MPNLPRLGLLPSPAQPIVRPMFRSLAIAASGLSAQRTRMEATASNLANSETTRTPDGTPYRRRVVRLERAEMSEQGYGAPAPGQLPFSVPPFGTPPFDVPAYAPGDTGSYAVVPDDPAYGVRVAGVEDDASEGTLVYEPGHPDADANGYVRYPNVRVTDELIDLMDARRVYEANATVFQSAKAMLRRAIDI
jgi:flagellar basal-body rod protein FlgC